MSDPLTDEEVQRRIPAVVSILDEDVRAETYRLTANAPAYFWDVAASTSEYHHPICRKTHGLWAHTLMVCTAIERLGPSYVERGLLEDEDLDLARSAAILHDQRKNGLPEDPQPQSTFDHDLLMARVIRDDSELPERVADAVASHMGPWYDGPAPETPLEELVHNADMVASTASIECRVTGPIPEELGQIGVREVER